MLGRTWAEDRGPPEAIQDEASNPLAHPGWEDAKLVPVLGHRPPGDLHSVGLEEIHDGLIGQRSLESSFPTKFWILSFTPRALISSPLVVESPEEKKNLSE